MYVYLKIKITVKKIGHGLEHVKKNLKFFGLSLNFYSNFTFNFNFTATELID